MTILHNFSNLQVKVDLPVLMEEQKELLLDSFFL